MGQVAANIEAEQALLGAMLAQNQTVPLVSAALGPQHFGEPIHARIFEAIVGRVNSGKLASAVTLKSQFEADKTLAEIGGPAYLARLVASATTVINAPHYANVVKEVWARREGMIAADQVSAAMASGDMTGLGAAKAQLEAANAVLDELGGAGGRKSELSLYRAVDTITERLNDVATHGLVLDPGVYPGSKQLEDLLGPWRRGRYYVVGARPGMGKTTVASSWLVRSALRGAGVLFFSLEMTAEEIGERVLSDVALSCGSRIEYSRINRIEVKDQELAKLVESQDKLRPLEFKIIDRPALTLTQIRSYAAKEKQRLEALGKRMDVICVDHIGLVKAADRYAGNKVAETEEISIALKAMAKDLDCAVVALCQLNRGNEAQEDKRPTLANLRWSGSIEQDADVVMFCYRPAYYLERKKSDDPADEQDRMDQLAACKNKLEIIVAKHRGGPCRTLEFYCDMGCSAVRDIN